MAHVRGDILYGSRPIPEWPHFKLLCDFERIGESIWEPGVFERTAYYENATANIDTFGNYFDAYTPDQIQWSARRFLAASFPSHEAELLDSVPSWTVEPREHVAVRPILHSSCFQVVEGHHRLAALYFKGIEEVNAVILTPAVTTPLQDLLLETVSPGGHCKLYQPIDSPEVKDWAGARHCEEMAAMMIEFLRTHSLMLPELLSYLDVGCGYGWFVRQMADRGFLAEGVESDPTAISIGTRMNGLTGWQLHCSDAIVFLRSNRGQSDVVSCYSLARYYRLHRHRATAEELLHLLDTATRRVLFLDMSEEHECDGLEGSNPEQIRRWILGSTTFSDVLCLGKREDADPAHEGSMGITVFACMR